MRAHLVILIALVLSVEIHPALSKAQASPQLISDVVVVTDETTAQLTTYVADETSGAIYSQASPVANALTPSQLKLTDFGVFFHSPVLPKPSGIAYYNGKLVVCDRQLAAVFEIDTTTKILNLLVKGDPLREPTRVAVSQTGRVAVSNNAGEIILYDRSTKLVKVQRQFNSPIRLAFAGEDLLILDRQGTILLVQAKSLDADTPVVLPIETPAKVGSDIAKIKDFAFLNGVYYLAGENQVDAYIRSKGIAIQLFSQPVESVSFSGVAANKQAIVLKDARNNTLWRLERPVPVTASFSKETAQSLVFLYEYLLARKTLPIRQFVATRDYKSLEELLLDQKIIFGESSSSSELVKFVCQLNASFCLQSQPNNPLPINRKVRKGQSLTLPDLSYSEVIGYETKYLVGESVKDYLTKTFAFSPNIQSRFSEDFLWSLNELSRSQTLEVQLQTKVPGALLAVPPRRGMPPGTIIRVGKEQDYVTGSVNNTCGVEFKYGSKTFNLATRIKNSITGSVALAQLPRAFVQPSFTKRLKEFGVDEVQFELDAPRVEQGDQKAINAAMALFPTAAPTPSATPDPLPTPTPSSTADPRTCMIQRMTPSSYLVVDSVKVKSGRYKIFKNNAVVHLSKSEIQHLGLLGEPDPTGEWSLVLNDPYYVAYRLSPWNDQSVLQSPITKIIMSPRQIRPGGSQDIFGLKDVSLLLPYVRQWQVTFLINESELTNDTSDFSRLKANHKFTAVRAEESIRVTATIGPTSVSGPNEQIPLGAVTRNREILKREINFPSSTNGVEVKIGIAEKLHSVDKKHPDFFDQQCISAWIREPTDPPPDPCVPSSGDSGRVKSASEIVEDNDHGTHVAGLIGTRPNTLAPGLLPSAKLYLVDTTLPERINPAVENAKNRGVFIFNFSFGLEVDDSELHEAIRDTWTNRLFIVAVDNEGTDLTYSKNPMIGWMDDTKNNMLGVGSSIGAAGTEYVLGDWQSYRGIEKGSSYSKRYVHLVAPGQGIYSTVPGNAYGEMTGASQAAPQVSAAAALLFDAEIGEPPRIKARLIYTSDWFEQFRGKVWGGFLNVNRAVWEPKRNLVIPQGPSKQVQAIILKDETENPPPMTIKYNRSTRIYEPTTETTLASALEVPFAKILRITALSNKLFRVIFLDQTDRLKIALNADISGKFPCQALERWDPPNFSSVPCYANGLDVSQVSDYVARTPRAVTFAP